MEISITSASEMMKVARSTIYKKIESGELSRCASGKVETSELFRVFGSPTDRTTRQEEKTHIEDIKTLSPQDTATLSLHFLEKTALQAQIKILEEALTKADEREVQHLERESQHMEQVQWQRQHIDKLTDTIKLLEPPAKEQPKQAGFLSRLFRTKIF